ARAGEHHRIEAAFGIEASDAGVDVATNPVNLQVRPLAQDLCLATYGRGADARARRKLVETAVRGTGREQHDVVHILAGQVGGERGALGHRYVAGDILDAVHG